MLRISLSSSWRWFRDCGGLGDRALHHDETLHAFFSWLIFHGEGYVHDPLLHGPFLYFFGALIYFLFSVSDATARLGPALFGVAL